MRVLVSGVPDIPEYASLPESTLSNFIAWVAYEPDLTISANRVAYLEHHILVERGDVKNGDRGSINRRRDSIDDETTRNVELLPSHCRDPASPGDDTCGICQRFSRHLGSRRIPEEGKRISWKLCSINHDLWSMEHFEDEIVVLRIRSPQVGRKF